MFKKIRILLKRSMVFKITAVNSAITAAVFLCVAFIVCVINAVISVAKEKQIMEIYIHNTINTVDNKLKDMARVSLIAFSDNTTQDILQNIEQYSYSRRLESTGYLQKLYTDLISLRNDIHSVYLFSDKELVFYQTMMNFTVKTDYDMKKFINRITRIESRPVNNSYNFHMIVSGQPEFLWYTLNRNPFEDTCIYIIREVKTFSPNERIGHIVLVTPVSALKDAFLDFTRPYFSFLLFSADGTVIYSDNTAIMGKNIDSLDDKINESLRDTGGSYYASYQGKKSQVSYQISPYSGITLLTAVPLLHIYKNTVLVSILFVFLFLFVICTVILLTGKYTKAVIGPIVLLSEIMSKFSKENMNAVVPIDREDEAGRLSGAFNSMVGTIKDLILEEYEKTIELKNAQLRHKEMELRYLHAQINPHFLYNTLDNIRIKAAVAGNNEAADMIMLLVEFFRGNMETASPVVPIKKEINLIKMYLDIMRYRYPGLEADFNIDKSLLETEMPSFILQPVVENSLVHGLKNRNYSGKITISLYTDTDAAILLTVSDNGIGLNEYSRSRIEEMLEAPDIDKNQGERHIGIINIAQRLRMFYNGGSGLSYQDNPDGGVTAVIRIGEKCGDLFNIRKK